ncbi:hypothetical protein BC830DRAFT_1115782 [Chytriomyces sp. MP71]|nr:hypothetical protein BC830DRAFT_1115782 [Chytriomyces sp. MP71]
MHALVLLTLQISRVIAAPAPQSNPTPMLGPGPVMNAIGDPCGPLLYAPPSLDDPTCNPANLTCLLLAIPPLHVGGPIWGHGPVLLTTADASSTPSPTTSEPPAPTAEPTRQGQCVIRAALRGQACGTFISPAVVCTHGLQCVYDLPYPPLNATQVEYGSVNGTSSIGGEMGACVGTSGPGRGCNGPSMYPPMCASGYVCSVAKGGPIAGVCVGNSTTTSTTSVSTSNVATHVILDPSPSQALST